MAAAIGQELRKSIVEKMKRDSENNNVTSSSPIATKTTTTKEEKIEPMKETEE